jgi:hypothetical protein
MQNRYNHPSAQMDRLIAAGLNPHLIYGSGQANTGVADKIAPSKAAPYNVKNPFNPTDSLILAQLAKTTAEARNIESQTKERENLLQARLERLTLDNINTKITNSNLDDIQKQKVRQVMATIVKMQAETKEIIGQNEFNDLLRSVGANPKVSSEFGNIWQSSLILLEDLSSGAIETMQPLINKSKENFNQYKQDLRDMFNKFNKNKK